METPQITVTADDLTLKQEAFCQEYVRNKGNATEAARKAGYEGAYETLRSIASENLTKPYLKARIQSIQEDLRKMTGVTKEYVVARIVDNLESARLAQKHSDVNKSAELLGKTLGAFVDRSEISGANGGPIKTAKDFSDEELAAMIAAGRAAKDSDANG